MEDTTQMLASWIPVDDRQWRQEWGWSTVHPGVIVDPGPGQELTSLALDRGFTTETGLFLPDPLMINHEVYTSKPREYGWGTWDYSKCMRLRAVPDGLYLLEVSQDYKEVLSWAEAMGTVIEIVGSRPDWVPVPWTYHWDFVEITWLGVGNQPGLWELTESQEFPSNEIGPRMTPREFLHWSRLRGMGPYAQDWMAY